MTTVQNPNLTSTHSVTYQQDTCQQCFSFRCHSSFPDVTESETKHKERQEKAIVRYGVHQKQHKFINSVNDICEIFVR